MTFLPLSFAAPAVLAALVLLPGIWLLLRSLPPRPRRLAFPGTKLISDLTKREETPARSPWWLTLLRMVLATALILALARPIWQPGGDALGGNGPVLVLLDNGWASAADWPARIRAVRTAIDQADDQDRPVILATTADGPGQTLTAVDARAARERLATLAPRPWGPDRAGTIAALADTKAVPGAVLWIADGLATPTDAAAESALATLAGDAPVTLIGGDAAPLLGLVSVDNAADALTVQAAASAPLPDAATPPLVRALDLKGFTIGEAPLTIAAGARTGTARLELPLELRNDIARVELAGVATAGAVRLVDDRWRRRVVGLISGASADTAQPLLSPLHYLRSAFAPFADVREPRATDLDQAVTDLVDGGASVIAIADVGRLPERAHQKLADWVEHGGVLIRFAGPRLVEGADDLLPVRLRPGSRVLGGSLSWEKPQELAPFGATSPFAGLEPPTDIAVTRQILAEPDANLPDRTWASLADGTPLVTAKTLGAGRVILFHVSADTDWSSLPLSGGFVEMLRRIVSVAHGVAGSAATGAGADVPLPPLRLLDGFGRFTAPGPDARPLAANAADIRPDRAHPPGLYGTDDSFRALNLLAAGDTLAPLDLSALPERFARRSFTAGDPHAIAPIVLGIAMALLLIDALAALVLSGALARRPRASAAGLVLALGLAAGLAAPPSASAQTVPTPAEAAADRFAIAATESTRLAYVKTGDPELDTISREGLEGLSQYLASRTALEPGEPIGVDLAHDELAFFPILYWPLSGSQQKPAPETMARVDAYMKNGGTILFDTRDEMQAGADPTRAAASPATAKLREILSGLDIPPLEPVPADHVLTKTFYLLSAFPGRFDGSPLWVEELTDSGGDRTGRPVRGGDGVSPILITANDLAGAWAIGPDGDYVYPTVPADPYQRELAYRTGVNIVMYTLTGNYKADQVHVPSLLERLGQ